jgi:hypothetical protein
MRRPDSIELLAGYRVSVTGAVTNRVGVAAGNRSEGVGVSSAPAALPLAQHAGRKDRTASSLLCA